MPIVVNLDVMMAKRKMSLNELSARVDITPGQPVHPEKITTPRRCALPHWRLSARRWTVSRATCWNTCRKSAEHP